VTNLRLTLVAGVDPHRTRPGGIRSYVLGLARHMAANGADVLLMGIGGPANSEPFRFVAVSQDPNASSLAFQIGLRRTLRTRPINGGVIHAQRPDDLVPFLGPAGRCPLVTTIHGDPLPGIVSRHGRLTAYAYRRLERKGIRAARRSLFIDSQSRLVFSSRYPREAGKFLDTDVGIDLGWLHREDQDKALASWGLDGRPTVLFAGRFEREKNLPLIAQALALCETHPTLLLAGSGSQEGSIAKTLSGLSYRFLGVVPHERMVSLYSAVNVTVLASTREAMPLTCLESLACGTPVVATRTGRIPELVVSAQNGFVVDQNPLRIASAIDRAINDGQLMRNACRASVERFSWDRVGPSLVKLYQEVLS